MKALVISLVILSLATGSAFAQMGEVTWAVAIWAVALGVVR